MENKLGVSEFALIDIEKKIINLKLNLLDYTYTFNKSTYDLEYLIRLHEYLFSEFYEKEDLGTRDLDDFEIQTINFKLNNITSLCIENDCNNIDKITSLIEEIWHLQPFIVGNTRTMIAYLKILNDSFLLGHDIDVNIEIKNTPSIFKEICNVNQKRLTLHK